MNLNSQNNLANQNRLVCYTRHPGADEIYAARLANSLHLGLLNEDGGVEPLNHDYGVAFAKATQDANGLLHPKCLQKPYLFACKTGWAVVALRCEPDGSPDPASRGSVLVLTTPDFVHYTELPLLPLQPGAELVTVACTYDPATGHYIFRWQNREGVFGEKTMADLTGAGSGTTLPAQPFAVKAPPVVLPDKEVGNALTLPPETLTYLCRKLQTPLNVENTVPPEVTAHTPAALAAVRATACYSDGTACEKRVDWNTRTVNWETPGVYPVAGRIHQAHFSFPVAWSRADPCLGCWEGRYYFIATNDADFNHTLYIRQAKSVAELATAQECKILDTETYPHLGNLLWAPEFHEVDGRLYIFHGGTPGPFEEEQCLVMALKPGADPTDPSGWEMPRRIVRRDGSPLYGAEGITLDLTCFAVKNRLYAVWSQRQFQPQDLGAWLYMAELDPTKPWQLLTDPVVLATPEYGWENNHTFVVEGPFALLRGDKVYLAYSGGAVDTTYAIGLLTADQNADLLNPASWRKNNCPLLSSASVPGEYGPGHNAFLTDENGVTWNSYHARPGLTAPRSTGIRRVHFDIDGEPMLDLTEERDLVPSKSIVHTMVIV